MPTLVLIRHAKSDWSATRADRDRPLAARGQRQGAEAGRWLAEHGPTLDVAVVSPATRARATWDLVAEELPDPPPAEIHEAAYTFDGEDLLEIVRGLDERLDAVALVGHNPAMEELLRSLTGEWHTMPTSCIAVLRWDGPWSTPDDVELVAHGRPPT
ncbi:SixA phosphatase family protein [Nocardioides coralli]|uniref:SixA phosphatase family protein n=1 Tax=Nocardioides coralli TaxID=2872154 RepID=UPI001CA3CA1F|nr:histidine phosphatase family protein [Nocardioides coralli]QZY28758.1 histidine phosphatase family protein [Nocardioides coralli]